MMKKNLKPPKSLLIDTNILFPMEDNNVVDVALQNFSKLCQKHQIKVFVHESSQLDINRDKDEDRKKISLSKFQKYPMLTKINISKEEKESKYGKIKNENDDVDTDLLHTLSVGAIDYLVTEDSNLHKRTKQNKDVTDKVLHITGIVDLITQHYEPVTVSYPRVDPIKCGEAALDFNHPFFDQLKEDYGTETFVKWLNKSTTFNREGLLIKGETGLDGLIILKSEHKTNLEDKKEHEERNIPGEKVLKICLFRLETKNPRAKFGEQLLKTAMAHAFKNNFNTIYLTVFPKHADLIGLIKKFGFIESSGVTTDLGELVFYKNMNPAEVEIESGFAFHKKYWPKIDIRNVNHYIIPITPEYHDRLFPDVFLPQENPMLLPFNPEEIGMSAIPGNAIRKVYISHSPTSIIEEGSILWFYRSQDGYITSVGIAEKYEDATSFEQLRELIGFRSVFHENELKDMIEKRTVRVLNFYYSFDLESSDLIGRDYLKSIGISNLVSTRKLNCEKSIQGLMQKISTKYKRYFYGK